MITRSPAGYSGTPLIRKLGIVAGMKMHVWNEPDAYRSWLDPIPVDAVFEQAPNGDTDLVHLFVDRKVDLAMRLAELRTTLKSTAAIWVSWPKKASKVPTDVTEDTIREVALPLGFVDIKVCAVSEVWSGLKLVLRKENR